MKNKNIMLGLAVLVLGLAGCGKEAETEVVAENNMLNEVVANEENVEATEQEEAEATEQEEAEVGSQNANALLDEFLAGNIDAYRYEMPFNVSALEWNTDDVFAYSVGERLDLDNDGENEQILDGPYGGMFLDVIDDKVVVFEEGEGSVDMLSYTYYKDAVWVMHQDTQHTGRQAFFLTKYHGSDQVEEKISLMAEYWESDFYDEGSDFYFGDEKITMQEFEKLRAEITGVVAEKNLDSDAIYPAGTDAKTAFADYTADIYVYGQ